MFLTNRILLSNNGVLTDLSSKLNNHLSGTSIITASSNQILYMGADLPFNNRWVEVVTGNDSAVSLTLAIWDGQDWNDVIETIDLTTDAATGTKTFNTSERIIWVPDKDESNWSRDDTNDTSNNFIDGLETVDIYDLYWLRMTFSAVTDGATEVKFIGFKFSSDEDLYSLYPEFDTLEAKERFNGTLTTWDQVHFETANQIVRDLKAKSIATSGNQVLDWTLFRVPAIHKTAEIIFNAYGSDWSDEVKNARSNYFSTLNMGIFNLDKNKDATLAPAELRQRTGWLTR